MTDEERSDAEIRADLARLGELDAAFRERVAQVKAGQRMPRGGLSDPAASSERNHINARLVGDVPALLSRLAVVDAERAPRALYSQKVFAERVFSAATGTTRSMSPGSTWDQFVEFCDAAVDAVADLAGERQRANSGCGCTDCLTGYPRPDEAGR